MTRRRGSVDGEQLPVWAAPDEEAPVSTQNARRRTRSPVKRQWARCNPAMLAWARKTAGMYVADAAKRLRIKADSLNAWEAGTERPTIQQLRRLAAAYKRPMASFYLPAPPREFAVAKDHHRLPGDDVVAYSTALLFALRSGEYRRVVILGLEPDAAPSPLVGGHSSPKLAGIASKASSTRSRKSASRPRQSSPARGRARRPISGEQLQPSGHG